MATPGMLCSACWAVLQLDRQDLSPGRDLIFEMDARVGSCPHSTCNWLLVLCCYLLRFRHASVAVILPACACGFSLRIHFKVPGQCHFYAIFMMHAREMYGAANLLLACKGHSTL